MRNKTIAYALDFVSFLIEDAKTMQKIRKIILFGSVARGIFDEESDVDLFIDVVSAKGIGASIEKRLRMFNLSERKKKWELKGISNPISLKMGQLEKWELKRDILSDGLMLYGKYEEIPKDLKYYFMFRLDFGKRKFSEKMKIWRKLYGYRQKIGKKTYLQEGVLNKLRGKKIGRSVIIVPASSKKTIIDFLRRYKIKYMVNEIWSDTL